MLVNNARMYASYCVRCIGRFLSRVGGVIERAGWFIEIDGVNSYRPDVCEEFTDGISRSSIIELKQQLQSEKHDNKVTHALLEMSLLADLDLIVSLTEACEEGAEALRGIMPFLAQNIDRDAGLGRAHKARAFVSIMSTVAKMDAVIQETNGQ